MFTRALPFVALLLATLSLASPGIMGRQTSSTDFTLVAMRRSGAHAWSSLTLIIPSNTGSIAWIGITDSISSQNFTMMDGGLTAIASDGAIIGVSMSIPKENGLLEFTLVGDSETSTPVKDVYWADTTGLPFGYEFPYTLAVNSDDSNSFSLCQRTGNNDSALVYGAVGSNFSIAEYSFAGCEGVMVFF